MSCIRQSRNKVFCVRVSAAALVKLCFILDLTTLLFIVIVIYSSVFFFLLCMCT
jgi:hypothetical protein